MTPTSLAGVVGLLVSPPPAVRVVDQSGAPVAGVAVKFVHSDPLTPPKFVLTDANGSAAMPAWQLAGTAGTQRISASVPGVPEVVFTAIAQPGPVAVLRAYSGSHQAATAGTTVDLPLRAIATDAYNNPLGGIPVLFSIVSGGGSLAGLPAVTDAQGIASSGSWTLGTTPGLQEARAESGSLHAFFSAFGCQAPKCWSNDLAFVRDGQIHVRSGSQTRKLTSNTISSEADPAWSPDGSRIAFTRERTTGGVVRANAELYVTNADGSNERRLAIGLHSPAWSPDGRTLVAASGDCTYYCDLHILSAEPSGAAAVKIATQAAYASWSPDGTKIAFVRLSGDDGYHEMFVMSPDGSNVTSVVPFSSHGLLSPSWSPDGRRIAYSDYRNVFTVNADGSGLQRLTNNGMDTTASSAAWSPDGTTIATTRWIPGTPWTSFIVFLSADTGMEIAPALTPGYDASWRPGYGAPVDGKMEPALPE